MVKTHGKVRAPHDARTVLFTHPTTGVHTKQGDLRNLALPRQPNAIGQAKPLSRSLADSQSGRVFLPGDIRSPMRLVRSGLHVGAFLFDERLDAFTQ
jgi:hypothetical protein